jgi:RNA polymerase sigma factor (sigma-70 family)
MDNAEYNRRNNNMFRQLRLYEAGGDERSAATVRDKIALLNVPLVQMIASHIYDIQYDQSLADMSMMMADGMFAVAKAIRYYKDQGNSFSTYVYPIIRGEILRGLIKRKAAYKQMILNKPVGDDGTEIIDFEEQHDEWPGILDRVDSMKFLMGLLDERERYILRRRYWDGKNFREVGNELGISKQRAHVLEHRGLKKMRAAVAEDVFLEK